MNEIEQLKKEIEELKQIIESKNNQVESKNRHIKRLEGIISNMKKQAQAFKYLFFDIYTAYH